MEKSTRARITNHGSTATDRLFIFLLRVLAALMLALFILPLVALVWRVVDLNNGGLDLTNASLVSSLSLSLLTTSVSMLVIIIFGTPLAFVLSRQQFGWKKYLGVIVELPIVMPPVVAGLALLSVFGRRGLLGIPLSLIGIQLPFTPLAVIIAQVFVSSPFYIRAAQSAFNSLSTELVEAARIDGADTWKTFRQIMLPLSSHALLSGLLISWARALGEFGATILFAGNLAGSTQTMSLLVFSALERDLGATYATALILLALAVILLGGTRVITHLDKGQDVLSA